MTPDITGTWVPPTAACDYVKRDVMIPIRDGVRPLIGPLNATKVGPSTDAWDTIGWLVKNVPETPKPIAAGKTLRYRFVLPNANHVFLPGHRIMVQVQSSWFPLYDRNPQTFVPNIFLATPADYRKATDRVFFGGAAASAIELPVAPFSGR